MLGVDNNDVFSVVRGGGTQKLIFKGYQMRGEGNHMLISAADTYQLRLGHTSSTEQIVIDDGGNVGIGVTDPSAKLEVFGDIYISKNDGQVLTLGNSNYATKYITVREGANYAAKWGLQANTNIDGSGAGLMISSKPLAFKAGVSSATAFEDVTASHLKIETNGKVGIGEENPLYQLQVTGDIYSTGNMYGDLIVARDHFSGVDGTRKEVSTSTATAYTISSTNSYKLVRFSNTVTVTVNQNSLDDIGDTAEIENINTSPITVVGGNANLLVNPNFTAASSGQYSRISIQKVSSVDYRVFGELALA